MNSIKKFYNNNHKIAFVVNKLRHPENRSKFVVLVEGDDDVLFYTQVMNMSNVDLVPLGGCETLEYIIRCLSNYNRLLAIRDADFKRANNEEPEYDNLFLTDYHDIEMMQLHSGAAYSECEKYCQGSVTSTIVEDIQRELENVSYVRWHNQICHDEYGKQGICFDNAPICDAIYDARSVIDLDSYWKYIADKQTIVLPYGIDDVYNFKFLHSTSQVDLKQITNGHEAISALWCKIKVYYKRNLSKKQLAKEVREYYTIDMFKQTTLYREVQKWCALKTNKLKVFK